MSTKASILYHSDEERKIDIHIYEEVLEDPPNNIYLQVSTEYATLTIPWPTGLKLADVQKLAI